MGSKSLRYKAKRSLGQNFFVNENLAKNICSRITEDFDGTIIEIGSGTGVFTHLLQKTNPIISIEKDDGLSLILRNHFDGNNNVTLVNKDILNISSNEFYELTKFSESLGIRVFGSLPYNISKRIIEHLLLNLPAQKYFFIIQKEVARKYSSEKSSILKVRTDVLVSSSIILDIHRAAFNPQPKVTSSLIEFTRYQEPKIQISLYPKLCELLKCSFSNPRKTLHNNLKNTDFKIGPDESLGNLRPENISTDQFISILNFNETSTK